MKSLEYKLVQLCEHNPKGSYRTKADRKAQLRLIARELNELGFYWMGPYELKGRHINRLVAHWQNKALSPGTMKNRMAALRWWGKQVHRMYVFAKSNEFYGIEPRVLVNTVSKAQELTPEVLAAIDGPYREYIRVSLRLQRYFGLRMEESLKFRPSVAIEVDEHSTPVAISLIGSWCKNGRPRTVPVRTQEQRDVLSSARVVAGSGSLIPSHLTYTYIQYVRTFTYRTRKVGMGHHHSLRHQYCQDRYVDLTGSLPSNARGSLDDWAVDDKARWVISAEVGHSRKDIAAAYLGPAVRGKAKTLRAVVSHPN